MYQKTILRLTTTTTKLTKIMKLPEKMKSYILSSDINIIRIASTTDFEQTPTQKISVQSNEELVPHLTLG